MGLGHVGYVRRLCVKGFLIDRAVFSDTTQNHCAMVKITVLALKTEHGVVISWSLQVVLYLHQLEDYAASPQGEIFAKVLTDFKEQHPRTAGVDYTEKNLDDLRELVSKANDTRRQSGYDRAVDIEWEEMISSPRH